MAASDRADAMSLQTTYVGQEKLIVCGGRLFAFCDAAAALATEAQWARGVLAQPAVIYPNGRDSHEVACEVLDRAEDGLMDFLRVVV
jgi:hypothetical protein